MTCSDGLLRLLHLPPDARPTPDTLLELAHPDDRWIVDDLFRPSPPCEEEVRYRVRLSDGMVRWHGCWSEPGAGDDGVRRAVVREVTRSQAVAERLTRHHHVFDVLVGLSGGAVLRLDAQGVPHHSASWTQFTGQGQEDLRRRGWTGALHPDDRTRAEAGWSQAFAAGTPMETWLRVSDAGGGHTPMRLRAMPVVNGEGRRLEWLLYLSEPGAEPPLRPDAAAPTPAQLRGCRGLLDWTVSRLAAASGVSAATIARYESGATADPGVRPATLARVRAAVEAAGVRFTTGPEGAAIHWRPPDPGGA